MTIKTYRTKVIENIKVTQDVSIIRIEGPQNFEFNSGQYISVSVQIENKKVKRPYSIASVPKKDYLELCVKRVEKGPASNYLCDLKRGEEIEFFGPVGKFTLNGKKVESKDNLLFISTGTGIGPFASMINDLIERKHKGKIRLISGFKTEKEILYKNEFGNKIERINAISNERTYVQDFLNQEINEFDKIYICGLKEMIKEVKEKLSSLDFPKENIFIEEYD